MNATFQQFCETTLDVISPEQATRYPLRVLAHAYLQDWYETRPIDGGVAFETELRELPLDGSLASLALLDTFLDSIRPQLATDKLLLAQNASQRNLLNFIAFYAGAVYVYQANSPAYWLTFAQLTTRFPNLAQLMDEDFGYSMAVSRQDLLLDDRPFFAMNVHQTTFFPLVAILERLYPTLQTANHSSPLTGSRFGYSEPSLAQSVQTLLNQITADNISAQSLENTPVFPTDSAFDTPTNRVLQDVFGNAKLHRLINNPIIRLPSSPYQSNFIEQPFVHPFLAPPLPKKLSKKLPEITPTIAESEQDFGMANTQPTRVEAGENDLSQQLIPAEKIATLEPQTPPTNTETAPLLAKNPQKKPAKLDTKALQQAMRERQEQARQQKIAEALANPTINPKLLNQSHSMLQDNSQEKNPALASGKVKDVFTGLEVDLAKVPTDSTNNNFNPDLERSYQAVRDQLLHLQSLPANIPADGQNHEALSALEQLQTLATAQHTGAMLTLAILQFRGDSGLGIAQDTDSAMHLLQQAGKLEDSRAEKFLSRLYFSGELVEQNRLLAEDWLAKSASHGHPEAIELQQQLAIAQTLKASQQDDNKFRQQLIIGTAVMIVFLLIILLAVKI